MNAAQTCFILGAGASKPYGYPLGAELKDQVIRYCLSRPQECAPPDKLIDTWNYLETFAKRFEKDSESKTIDQFINTLKSVEDIELKEHGKMALAAVLGRYERPLLSSTEWYRFLWEHLRHFDRANPLKVITFNYDRSFEYAVSLFNQSGKSYPLTLARQQFCELVQIKHCYGQLATLPGCDGSFFVEYGEFSHNGWLAWRAREDVKFIWSEPDQTTAQMCRSWISEAAYIIVLGFGYHDENIKLLGLNSLQSGKCLFSSGYNLSTKERERVQKACLPAQIHFGAEDADIKTFLQQTEVLKWATEGRAASALLRKLRV